MSMSRLAKLNIP